MHMMTWQVLVFKTPEVLQSFPLKEISSQDLQSAKSVGLSSGKGNVSNTLTYKEFIKQQGLVRRLHRDQFEGCK